MQIEQKIGRLVIKRLFRKNTNRKGHKTEAYAECECECGNIKEIRLDGLKTIKSCGCIRSEKLAKQNLSHGCGTRGAKGYATYSSWQHMKDRCLNKNNKYYKNYGGRGITIDERWLKFENFLEDMGYSPKGYSIERLDNEKGYYKENCKWSSFQEQMNNTRRNHFLEYNGERKTIAQWARDKKITYACLTNRIKRGWSIERALR